MRPNALPVLAALILAATAGAWAQTPEPTSAAAKAAPASAQAEAGSPIPVAEPAKPAATGKSVGTPPSGAAAPGPAPQAASPPAAGGSARNAKGTDTLQLGTTEISGNRELPKVLYVVPWRRPEIGDAVGRPPNSLVEEALSPVDRDVFRRQNRYYAALQSGAAPAKSQPVAAGGAATHAAP